MFHMIIVMIIHFVFGIHHHYGNSMMSIEQNMLYSVKVINGQLLVDKDFFQLQLIQKILEQLSLFKVLFQKSFPLVFIIQFYNQLSLIVRLLLKMAKQILS